MKKKSNNEVKVIFQYMVGSTRSILRDIFKLLKKQDEDNLEAMSEKVKTQAQNFVSSEGVRELAYKFPTFSKENINKGLICYRDFVCWKVNSIIADKKVSFDDTPEGRRWNLDMARMVLGIRSNTYGDYKLVRWKKFYVAKRGL